MAANLPPPPEAGPEQPGRKTDVRRLWWRWGVEYSTAEHSARWPAVAAVVLGSLAMVDRIMRSRIGEGEEQLLLLTLGAAAVVLGFLALRDNKRTLAWWGVGLGVFLVLGSAAEAINRTQPGSSHPDVAVAREMLPPLARYVTAQVALAGELDEMLVLVREGGPGAKAAVADWLLSAQAHLTDMEDERAGFDAGIRSLQTPDLRDRMQELSGLMRAEIVAWIETRNALEDGDARGFRAGIRNVRSATLERVRFADSLKAEGVRESWPGF